MGMTSFDKNQMKSLVFSLIIVLLSSCNEPTVQSATSNPQIDQEVLARGFDIPYAIAVIGETEFLITERMGGLFHYRNGQVTELKGLPESVTYKTDRHYGGMMDISLHPQFSSNKMAYLAFVNTAYHLSVARFRFENSSVNDVEIIFTSDQFCIGSRIAWQDDEHFFLSFGVGGAPGPEYGPQDLSDPRGKIFRLMADGSIPADNPLLPGKTEPSGIWSYGHRDPQGLFYDLVDSILYSNEHGPLGGDEFNVITKGGNFGWPLFSYGLNYDGTKVSDLTAQEAAKHTVMPVKYWEPIFRLAPSCLFKPVDCNIESLNDKFLMGGLAYQHLVSYDVDTDSTDIVLSQIGRVRDVAQLPSGHLVILIDQHSPGWRDKGRVVKLIPKE